MVVTVATAVVSGAIPVIARRLPVAVMVLWALLWPICGACGLRLRNRRWLGWGGDGSGRARPFRALSL